MKLKTLCLVCLLSLSTMACAPKVNYGIESVAAKCDALREALPSYSTHDTEQTKREGLVFLDTFESQCNGSAT